MKQAGSTDYCTRIVTDLAQIDAAHWNALLCASDPSPFVRHEFLHALQSSGCATARTGWEPNFLTLHQRTHDERLVAAVPLYRKRHSYGEYVFDWTWADAHHRHDLEYYPKWLAAVPFTPVPGPRVLALDERSRDAARRALLAHAAASGLSSLHVLFQPESEARALAALGTLTRRSVQFHWFNRGYRSFDDYLHALTQPKRKKVRAERRKVRDTGVTLVRKTGRQISEADWRLFVRCYDSTYASHLSTPYLNLQFFLQLAHAMPDSLLLVIAERAGAAIAAALALFDGQRLYGRYWGALEPVPCLHFEVSYYQMIEFALERGLAVFEGGAQGEHKLARGFEPVTTYSSHWLAHPALHAAVARALERERGGVDSYVDELAERSALKAG